MLVAMFTMAFFGFLRCGEFTTHTSSNTKDSIRVQDIIVAADNSGYTLHLRTSKTDPFRQGVDIRICKNKTLCPVEAMLAYLKLRYRKNDMPSSPLFVNHNNIAITREEFLVQVKHVLMKAGFDDSKYCGHSFRIGAATTAARAGVEDHMIQALGRWSSSYTTDISESPQTLYLKLE